MLDPETQQRMLDVFKDKVCKKCGLPASRFKVLKDKDKTKVYLCHICYDQRSKHYEKIISKIYINYDK